jgi:peptidoglycan/LPS O-acetylase OafA/YrhL
MKTRRPSTVTIAAVLLALLGFQSLAFPLYVSEGVPAFIVYTNVAFGVAGIIAAAGLWALKRWAAWVAIALGVLGIVSAAPGIVGAPTVLLQVLAATGILGSALIILLVALPSSRRAHA